MNKFCLIACAFLFSFHVNVTHAGSSSANAPINFPAEDITSFSKKVEKALAEKGAHVAIVARVGRAREDLPEGIQYTHIAYWVYSDIQTTDGETIRGYVAHNLYQLENQADVSELINDYPADYFAGVEELDAGIIIPKPELQKRLLKVISSDTFKKLHNPNYSVIANPENTKFQNCTEHALNILMSSVYKTDDLAQIKANIKEYFDPQEIKLSPVEALFGPLFVKDVATSDHGKKIQTTTFTTIGKFMTKYDLIADQFNVTF